MFLSRTSSFVVSRRYRDHLCEARQFGTDPFELSGTACRRAREGVEWGRGKRAGGRRVWLQGSGPELPLGYVWALPRWPCLT
eukprot:6186794-Pleurochrysis_carterae.AAC.1